MLELADVSVEERCTSTWVAYPCVPTTVPADVASTETVVDPACSEPVPYEPPEPIEIVLHEAERTLTAMPTHEEGSTDLYLVPGYRFRGDQESVVDAVAVDDDSLAPPPSVEPLPADGRAPVSTGVGSDPVSDPDAPVSSPVREPEPVEVPQP